MEASLIDRVKAVIAQSLAVPAAATEGDPLLIAELGASSLDFVDILFLLEAEFAIELQQVNFDFLASLGLPPEDAYDGPHLSELARVKLLRWLPRLPADRPVAPAELVFFASPQTFAAIVEDRMPRAVSAPRAASPAPRPAP